MEIRKVDRPLPDWAETERLVIMRELDRLRFEFQLAQQPYIDRLTKLENYRPMPMFFLAPTDGEIDAFKKMQPSVIRQISSLTPEQGAD